MSFSSLWFHFPFSSHFHHSQSFLLFPLHFSPSRDLLPASYLSRFLTFHSLSWSLPHFSFPLLVTSSLFIPSPGHFLTFHSLSWSLPLYFIPSPGHVLFISFPLLVTSSSLSFFLLSHFSFYCLSLTSSGGLAYFPSLVSSFRIPSVFSLVSSLKNTAAFILFPAKTPLGADV